MDPLLKKKTKHGLLIAAVLFLLMAGSSAYLFTRVQALAGEVKVLNAQSGEMNRYVRLSEKYTAMSRLFWGDRAGDCGVPVIKMVDRAVKQYGDSVVTADMALSVIAVESGFRGDIVSYAGAVGYMGVMPSTARQYLPVNQKDLMDPYINISCGVRYLAFLLRKYHRQGLDPFPYALEAYNRGPGKFDHELADRNAVSYLNGYSRKVSYAMFSSISERINEH